MKTLNNALIGTLIIILSLFSCRKEVMNGKDGIDGKDGICEGKLEVYFTGSITDEEAREIIKNEIGHLTQKIYVTNTSNLTTLNLSNLKDLVEINISGNDNLENLNLSNLEIVHSKINISQNYNLKSVDLPKLSKAGDLLIGNPWFGDSNQISTINVSNLKEALTLNIGYTKISTLSLPELNSVKNGINFQGNKNLATLIAPNLVSSQRIDIGQNLLTQISFPKFNGGDIIINNETSLSSVSFPSLNSFNMFSVSNNTRLNSTDINSLLYQFLTITPQITSKVIILSGQNPSAPPTGSGISHKNTLIGLGNSVYTD